MRSDPVLLAWISTSLGPNAVTRCFRTLGMRPIARDGRLGHERSLQLLLKSEGGLDSKVGAP